MKVRQGHRTEDMQQQQQRRVDGTRAFIVTTGVRMEGAVKCWGKGRLAKIAAANRSGAEVITGQEL